MKPLPETDLQQLCIDMREKAGYTQAEMAKRLGIGLQSYQKYEQGERTPNGNVTAKLFALKEELEAKKARNK